MVIRFNSLEALIDQLNGFGAPTLGVSVYYERERLASGDWLHVGLVELSANPGIEYHYVALAAHEILDTPIISQTLKDEVDKRSKVMQTVIVEKVAAKVKFIEALYGQSQAHDFYLSVALPELEFELAAAEDDGTYVYASDAERLKPVEGAPPTAS